MIIIISGPRQLVLLYYQHHLNQQDLQLLQMKYWHHYHPSAFRDGLSIIAAKSAVKNTLNVNE